jgi:hypothetical protein
MAQAFRSPEGPTMLYRVGHAEKLHDVWVDYTIVPHEEVEDALASGEWHRTPLEAKRAAEEAKVAAQPEPTIEAKDEAPAAKPTKK